MKNIVLALLLTLLCQPAFAAPPKVVTSIPPLHSLAACVLENVSEPYLLLQAGSPHSYTLRPSDARALQQADLLIWVGPELELFLDRAGQNLAPEKRLTLFDLPEIHHLPLRHGGLWEHDEEHAAEEGRDAHIWLDPDNAAIIIKAIADRLTRIDPDNGVRYQRNGADTIHRLRLLDTELRQRLKPLQHQPYIVFHDAYHAFEAHYGLQPLGSIAIDPERRPGARRLQQIRDLLLASGAVCLFREPQFEPRYVPLLIEGTSIRTGILDPLGSTLKPGPDLYFQLLRDLAANLETGLAPAVDK